MTARFLHGLSIDDYHALDAFNASAAKTVNAKSELHAHCDYRKPPSKVMDRGTILHALTLGTGHEAYQVLDYDEFRTNEAKAARDAVIASGRAPIKRKDLGDCEAVASSVRTRLAELGYDLDGKSEVSMEWYEGAVRCKGRMDHLWLHPGGESWSSALIVDLKFVEDASTAKMERYAESYGFGIQHAAYTRGVVAIHPALAGRVEMRFIACEVSPPYAINVLRPDGVFRELGQQRWLRAVAKWAKARADGRYPAYDEQDNHLTVPLWALKQEGFTPEEM